MLKKKKKSDRIQLNTILLGLNRIHQTSGCRLAPLAEFYCYLSNEPTDDKIIKKSENIYNKFRYKATVTV